MTTRISEMGIVDDLSKLGIRVMITAYANEQGVRCRRTASSSWENGFFSIFVCVFLEKRVYFRGNLTNVSTGVFVVRGLLYLLRLMGSPILVLRTACFSLKRWGRFPRRRAINGQQITLRR